jgi:ribonuclease G
LNTVAREKRWALMRDQSLIQIQYYQPQQVSLVENIYVGIVEKVEKGLNAAFVNIGHDKNGFLHLRDVPQTDETKEHKIHQGEKLLVQVVKDATGTKGPKLTAVIELKGQHLVYMPNGRYVAVSKKAQDEEVRNEWKRLGDTITTKEEGILFRTSALNQTEDAIKAELEELRLQYSLFKNYVDKAPKLLFHRDRMMDDLLELAKKLHQVEIVADSYSVKKELSERFEKESITNWSILQYNGQEDIFSHFDLESKVKKALQQHVWLSNGGSIVIEQTEAMTVIDVNTGKFTGKDQLKQTVHKTNIAAAKEIGRQIMLRNLSGMIMIDFVDMNKKEYHAEVISSLKEALRTDLTRTIIVGFNDLGVLQLTRKKTKRPLLEYVTTRCPVCQGSGRIESPETKAFQLERELHEYRSRIEEVVVVEVSEDVASFYKGEHQLYFNELQNRLKKEIRFVIRNHSHPFYHIKRFE